MREREQRLSGRNGRDGAGVEWEWGRGSRGGMEGVGRGSRGEWEGWEQWEEGGGTAFKFLEHGYLKTPSGSSNQLVRLHKVMGCCTAQCEMLLFCLKTIIKESPCFELAHLKKKVKKKERKAFWQSDDFMVQYFCDAFLCY